MFSTLSKSFAAAVAVVLVLIGASALPVVGQDQPGEVSGPEPALKEVDASKLPPLVRVDGADPKIQTSYDVPRADLVSLVKAGAIKDNPRWRFSSPQAAQDWFAQARPVPPRKDLPRREPLLTRLGETLFWDQGHYLIGRDGRVWTWQWQYVDDDLTKLRKQVEAAFQSKGLFHRLTEPYSLFEDSKNRLWVISRLQDRVLGYDPKTKEWIERRPDAFRKGKMDQPMYEDKAGRLYVKDSYGMHVLDGKTWTYQLFYERNFKEAKYCDNVFMFFCDAEFAEDTDGRVYVWSRWGRGGGTGTIGYWVYDGKTWQNETAVEKIWDLLPRGPKVWIFVDVWKNNANRSHSPLVYAPALALLEAGQLLTDERAKGALNTRYDFDEAFVLAEDQTGTAYLGLTTVRDPGKTTTIRNDDGEEEEIYSGKNYEQESVVLALPARGPVREVSSELAKVLHKSFPPFHNQKTVLAGPDKSLWVLAYGVVQNLLPDKNSLRTWPQTSRFTGMSFEGIDGSGQVYLTGSNAIWRMDPKQSGQLDESEPFLPAMRVPIHGDYCFKSGRIWCNLVDRWGPIAIFDGSSWKTAPEVPIVQVKGEPEDYPRNYRSVRFDADRPPLLLRISEGAFYLWDDKGWIHAPTMAELAKKYPERLNKALADSKLSLRDDCASSGQMFRDPKGRVWWVRNCKNWGVIDRGRVIDGKAAKSKLKAEHVSVLIALGDAGRVLAITGDRKSAILDVIDGRIVQVATPSIDCLPNAHPGELDWDDVPYFLESKHRFWYCNKECSRVMDEDGKVVKRLPGLLLLEDSRHGLWCRERMEETDRLVRHDPSGKSARLELPDARYQSLAVAPDGSMWALTQSDLIHIRVGEERLTVGESYPLSISSSDVIYCDAHGRVWHQHFRPGPPAVSQLLYYATAP